jgi:hypothetical protein
LARPLFSLSITNLENSRPQYVHLQPQCSFVLIILFLEVTFGWEFAEIPTCWHHQGLYKIPNLHHPAVNNCKHLPFQWRRVPWRWRIQEDTKDPWLQIRISFVYGKMKEMLIGQHLCRLQKNDGDADR